MAYFISFGLFDEPNLLRELNRQWVSILASKLMFVWLISDHFHGWGNVLYFNFS